MNIPPQHFQHRIIHICEPLPDTSCLECTFDEQIPQAIVRPGNLVYVAIDIVTTKCAFVYSRLCGCVPFVLKSSSPRSLRDLLTRGVSWPVPKFPVTLDGLLTQALISLNSREVLGRRARGLVLSTSTLAVNTRSHHFMGGEELTVRA